MSTYDHWKATNRDNERLGKDPSDEYIDEVERRFERMVNHYTRLLDAGHMNRRDVEAGLRELEAWRVTKLRNWKPYGRNERLEG